ncbi:AGE family epimerase/isomerase [Flavivirga spongiicola]|uniref:Cellobiose 2-epimerase n=1 Tax=Flavivirga spongiicola TaxID=421621 RepID=A0ABU7XZA6_9FLAO|nr:AGE family epimerase/isomerase [Flavivirga sp. MEBiC05379]MDO5980266.1 AGE family epimerase/isomerase [Flavivirga sp. MEBiC05379]
MTYNFKSLREELDATVQKNILDYWVNNAVDVNNGGFIGQVSHDNIKDINANKGIVLNSRILWTFSIAYRELNDAIFKSLADRAYNYIKTFFLDKKYGGVYWELDSLGHPVQKKKQIYAQAFTIYALTEYYKISKNSEALDWAKELFDIIEQHSYDEKNQGYIEAFAEDWSVLEDMRLSDKDANQEKTMNTHLHILEAYTNLYKVWPNGTLKRQQESLIKLFLSKFIDTNDHLNLFFTNAWENRSRVISFGHDIECAWLLTEAAEVIDNEALILKTREASIRISKKFISEALDTDGGIINERNSENGHVDYEKHWWQHAEALVGLMNAYTISNDEKFISPIFTIWEFIKKNLIDHQNGEWFWKVDKEGVPDKSQEKIGFWKCPYHNSRACFEMINRINSISNINA